MLKNKLSGLEQEVYFTLLNKTNRLFTIDVIKRFKFTDYATLRVMLSSMVKKGWLIRLKNGVYYLSENGNAQIDDMFRIAPYVYSGYIGFSSALYIYNAVTERPYTIYVATKAASRSKTIEGIEVKAVSLGRRALGGVRYGDYYVSSRPKTIYDCFHMPEYAGGYSKVLETISSMNLNAKEWAEFLKYVEAFETGGSRRKIGYMLELLNTSRQVVPKGIISKLNVPGHVIKLGSGRKSIFNKDWNVADYLGRTYLLGWSK